MEPKKETIWTRLAGGQLPGMAINTDVSINQASVINAGAILFIVVVLIIAAFFTLKKYLV